MPVRPASALRVVWPLVAGVVAAACSMDPAEPEPPPQITPALAPLYEQVRESWQDYERGLARIIAGDEIDGRNLLAAATDRMAVAARLCARTSGCASWRP